MKNESDDLQKYLDGREAFTGSEMRNLLGDLGQSYEIARVVDSDECRVLHIREDGSIEYGEPCYSVWGNEVRCSHCTSFRSCKVNAELSRSERIGGRDYRVRSVPVRLIAGDGTEFSCTLELINPELNHLRRVEENDNNMQYVFFHDVLTGTLNSDGLQRVIRRELEENPHKAYMLVMTDVSRFRLVNDLFGKQKGSDVLMAIGELLKNYGEGGHIVGRARDDQFVLFVPAEDFSVESLLELLMIAERQLDRPYYHLCIHAAIYPILKRDQQLPVSVMLDHARFALDTIRDNQQQRLVWFTDDMLDDALAEQKMAGEFRNGLLSGEFSIWLEPRAERGGAIAGAETVTRWIREDGEEVPAGRFVPVLERTGLIADLNRFTWKAAAELLAPETGAKRKDRPVTVDVSPRDLYYFDVVNELTGLRERYQIPEKRMHLSVTGSCVTDSGECLRMIRELHDKGFYIEIGDIGTRAPSLGILENVEADLVCIRLDPLAGDGMNDRSKTILAGVIDLAHRLGMDVLAKNIQTEEQKKTLEELGCTYFQGSAVAELMTAEEFARLS